ncbi:MAG TPA: hypothetical protein PKD75_01820 [Tepidiformaceae bacterium]|nr:hypothetical protein [Tepidiformaceae bacterium]
MSTGLSGLSGSRATAVELATAGVVFERHDYAGAGALAVRPGRLPL